jgi:CRISPR-associated exonuclease Cas4
MYAEDTFVPISALQHYWFCPRQCALIHVEDAWSDNVFTVRGNLLHEKVDTDSYESRGAIRTVRGLRIHSFRLGLVGRADVVEFHDSPVRGGRPIPLPVEYKAGKAKQDDCDRVQLCAQALCLEEMLGVPVLKGAFFYGRIRRRVTVEINEAMRRQTEDIVCQVRDLIDQRITPPAKLSAKCHNCSLIDTCVPAAMNHHGLDAYIKELYQP